MAKGVRSVAVTDHQSLGFRVWAGMPQTMPDAHRHHDVEVNVLHAGLVRYLLGESVVTLPAERLCVFWAAMPHQLIETAPGTRMTWITVPLTWVFRWQLPERFTRRLLGGRLLAGPGLSAGWLESLERWCADLREEGGESARVAALEVEACMRRLARGPVEALGASATEADVAAASAPRPGLDAVERMARYLAQHYREPVQVADVAAEVDLHPNYAMTLFRRHTGMSLIDYLTRQRIWRAQRLLVTTDRSVLDIAFDSGFGSASRFYEAFRRVCGQSPTAYRAAVRGGR